MTEQPTIRQLAAPAGASTTRRGSAVELLVLHSDPRPAARALADYARPAATRAPHYYVDAAGAVTQLVPEERAALHSGLATWRGRRRSIDRIAVGVALENAPGVAFTPAQAASLGALARAIFGRYGLGQDDVVAWAPPARGEEAGALSAVFLPLPPQPAPKAAPIGPAVLGPGAGAGAAAGARMPAPAVLSGAPAPDAGQRLWLALQEEAFKRRGGIGFQAGWAFHLHAASQGLGAPLAPAAPADRWVSHGGKRYNYQVFGRDTIFNEGTQWTAVQSLAGVAGSAMPAAGSLAALLLRASYDDAIAAGPQPPTGKTGLQPEQAMPQLALRERLGPALSGNYAINVAGASYAMQVFAGDTLFTPVAPAGKATNWGVVKRLSQEPAGAVRDALWAQTYKVSGAPFQPDSPFHQAAEREKLGAPLGSVVKVSADGQTYDAQVFAVDTLYAAPGQPPQRASALPKPAAVTAWKPAAPGPAAPTPPRPAPPAPPAASARADWPPAPGFRFLSTADREKLFGKFAYRVNGDRTVTITDGWDRSNIIDVPTPQLARLRVVSVKFHRRAAPQLQALLAAWEQAGLIDRILAWNGTYNPRLMRKLDQLSSHAWGTAFDINAAQNGQGVIPPLVGQAASVRELVPLAVQHGFYWGGHFSGAFIDGMHFEVAVLL